MPGSIKPDHHPESQHIEAGDTEKQALRVVSEERQSSIRRKVHRFAPWDWFNGADEC